jgi:type VI protein secretion system component Hcp
MPSDAFMEVSDPNVWGETFDQTFEGHQDAPSGRHAGAFEISSFNFEGSSVVDHDEPVSSTQKSKPTAGALASGGGAAVQAQTTLKQFTVNKWIDAASPDLFLAHVNQTKLSWAVITLREQGEHRRPWLILEFRNLYVDEFTWNVEPGVSVEEAKAQEVVKFSFGAILFKYAPQKPTGGHEPMSVKHWNREHPDQDVPELSSQDWG